MSTLFEVNVLYVRNVVSCLSRINVFQHARALPRLTELLQLRVGKPAGGVAASKHVAWIHRKSGLSRCPVRLSDAFSLVQNAERPQALGPELKSCPIPSFVS